MEATATELNKTYVDPNDRVLDPSLIEKSLIERTQILGNHLSLLIEQWELDLE